MYQHVKRSRSLDFWKQVCWEIRLNQASNSATLALFPLLSHGHVIIWSCLSSLKLLPCLHVQIICPFSFLSLFKSSNPGNVALSHSFRVPRCVSFHSIQFTALFEQIVSVFWWQFGNMWNLNFYEMAKEERVPIYQYIWQTIYCNIQAFRVNI